MTFWSMNSKNLNISSMNYGDVEQVAKAIEINGQVIYDSVNTIRNLFQQIESSGFAGSTLQAVLGAMDKLTYIPTEIQEYCQKFSATAYAAVEEVKQSESQELTKLMDIVNSDPTKFELPDWAQAQE